MLLKGCRRQSLLCSSIFESTVVEVKSGSECAMSREKKGARYLFKIQKHDD